MLGHKHSFTLPVQCSRLLPRHGIEKDILEVSSGNQATATRHVSVCSLVVCGTLIIPSVLPVTSYRWFLNQRPVSKHGSRKKIDTPC